MRTAILTVILSFTSLTYAAEPECGVDLAGQPLLERLRFTDWNSQFGYYRKLSITGVRQAKDEDDKTYYVFDGKDKPTQIFREDSVERVRDSHRLGLNGPIFQTFYKMRLVEVGANGEAIAGEIFDVERLHEYDGHAIDRWTFVKNDGDQQLTFYDPVAERGVIAARKAENERLASIPDPGSKEHIRQEIYADLRRQGLDPARQHWIEDEVNRQWADMWRMLTN